MPDQTPLTPEGVRALIADARAGHEEDEATGSCCSCPRIAWPCEAIRLADAAEALLPREDADLDALAATAFPLDGATPALVFAFREVFAKGYAAARLSCTAATADPSTHPFVGGKGTDLCRRCGLAVWTRAHDHVPAPADEQVFGYAFESNVPCTVIEMKGPNWRDVDIPDWRTPDQEEEVDRD